MLIVQVGKGVDIEVACSVNSGVEHKTCPSSPVAINILRTRRPHTCHRVEGHLVANSVARGIEAQPRGDGTLVTLLVVVEEQTEVLGERRLQSRITLTDVHRVAVVSNVEQVTHRGLGGVGIILDAHLADFIALPTEIDGRGEVRHSTRGISMQPLIVLREVGLLRHKAYSGIEGIGLTHDTQHDLSCMYIVLVFGEAAQVIVEIATYGLIRLQVTIPRAVLGSPGSER